MVFSIPDARSFDPKLNRSLKDCFENAIIGRHLENIHRQMETRPTLVSCWVTIDHTP